MSQKEKQKLPAAVDKKERISWSLTQDQHDVIQSELPKGYALLKPKKNIQSSLKRNEELLKEAQRFTNKGDTFVKTVNSSQEKNYSNSDIQFQAEAKQGQNVDPLQTMEEHKLQDQHQDDEEKVQAKQTEVDEVKQQLEPSSEINKMSSQKNCSQEGENRSNQQNQSKEEVAKESIEKPQKKPDKIIDEPQQQKNDESEPNLEAAARQKDQKEKVEEEAAEEHQKKQKKHRKSKKKHKNKENTNLSQSQQSSAKAQEEMKETEPHSESPQQDPKKYSKEHRHFLDKCSEILLKLKNREYIQPFLSPVNEERDGAPNYYSIIKQPIDLQTIENKVINGQYNEFDEFDQDVQRMWDNSFVYNSKNNCMIRATNLLRNFYRKIANTQGERREEMLKRKASK